MSTLNSPLRFQPIYQKKIWGGDQLKSILNKEIDTTGIGESWELSTVPDAETFVAEGPHKGATLTELIGIYKGALLGEKVFDQFGTEFPLLIKFIDAAAPLSVQVHPDDQWARSHHNSFGKNEMWYILNAAPGAELILGFQHTLSKNEFKQHLTSGTLEAALHREKVSTGDAFFIPTGLVHAIGAGVLLVEIQQTSDITYRIYDYNRTDAQTGATRALHIDQALAVADLGPPPFLANSYERKPNQSNTLIDTHYFKTRYLNLEGRIDRSYAALDSFVVLIGVKGVSCLIIDGQRTLMNLGEVLFLPANVKNVRFEGQQSALIEVFMP